MNPIDFEYRNAILTPAYEGKYSGDVIEIVSLPVWTNNEQCISCWKPSLRERLSILFFGKVWVAVLSGGSQPPVAATGKRKYFIEIEE